MPPPQDVSDKTGDEGIGENSKVTLSAKHSETEVMTAVTWAGKTKIGVQNDRPKPLITDKVRWPPCHCIRCTTVIFRICTSA